MSALAVTPMFFALLAPLFSAAVALGSTVVGQALIGTALSLGLGYLSRKLQPQPDTSARGMSLSLQADNNDDRQVAFGRCASAGSLKYHNTYGPNGNDYLQLIFQLADHECDALEAVMVDGVRKNILADASTALVTGNAVQDYAGNMWVKFYPGAWSQSADADIIARAPSSAWSSTDRGRGVCYVRVTLKADPSKFKTGLPELVFIFRGAKLYDPRKDPSVGGVGSHSWGNEATYEWTDNTAICLYNYLRGIRVNGALLAGVNAPAASLPAAWWMGQANLCDEAVALKFGGTEPRYRMAGIVDVGTEPRSVIREMLAACAGDLIDSGGVFKLQVGATQSPVMTITDLDIMAEGDVEIVPKVSRSQIVNTVYGSFTDPSQGYQSAALPPRVSPADQTADGGAEWAEHYNLAFVTSATQGQRITEIFRRRSRYQRRISLPLRSSFAVLEAGDWVTINSDRYDIAGATFEVLQSQLGRDLVASVELAEVASAIYAWTPLADELDAEAPRDVASGAGVSVLSGWSVANVTINGGVPEVTTPGLRATWAPISDPSVTEILIEFRRVGDTVALERSVKIPSAGEYTWVEGVQGATVYEARALLVTNPPRGTDWTGWASTGTSSGPQAVATSVNVTEVLSVPPDTITPEMLSAQSRLELSLATASAALQGSVAERLDQIRQDLEAVAASAIGTTASMSRKIEQVRKVLDGTAVSVTELLEVTDGLVGRWAITVDVDGRILGAVELAGGPGVSSSFRVLADNFSISSPGEDDLVPFVVIPGVGIFLDGVFIKDGTITAEKISALELSAITANIGLITAGRLQNAANTSFLDLNTGDFQLG